MIGEVTTGSAKQRRSGRTVDSGQAKRVRFAEHVEIGGLGGLKQ